MGYFESPGLSFSRMKDLEVSPLRYWFRHINPDREEEEETPFMRFGSALHCAVLEPDQFEARYCHEPELPEGCLDKADDLKNWLRERGHTPKGTKKEGWIAQVRAIDGSVPIARELYDAHDQLHAGKVQFSANDWKRINDAATALLSEPRLNAILKDGKAEVEFHVTDPETGVPLRAKMDWVSDLWTVDLKTFSQMRGKSIDQTVADAIFYERYYRQAYFYSYVRALAEGNKSISGAQKAPPFVMAFVESESPHETRIFHLAPKAHGEVNLFWEKARLDVRSLIRKYAECLEVYGDKPWRSAREIEILRDEDMKGMAYA